MDLKNEHPKNKIKKYKKKLIISHLEIYDVYEIIQHNSF